MTGRVAREAGPPFVVATVRSEQRVDAPAFVEVERTRSARPFELTVHGAGVNVRVDPENARLWVREYTRTEDRKADDGQGTLRSEIAEIRGGDYVRVKGSLDRSYEADPNDGDPYRGAPEAHWRVSTQSTSRRMEIHRAHQLESRTGGLWGPLVGVLELGLAIFLGVIAARTIAFEATARSVDAIVTSASPRKGTVEAMFEADGIQRRCVLASGDVPASAAERGRRIKIRYSVSDPRDCSLEDGPSFPIWQKAAILASGVLFFAGVFLRRRFHREAQWVEA